MYKKGKLKIVTKYSETSQSISNVDIIEINIGGRPIVGYSPVDVDPQRMMFVNDFNLEDPVELDYVFHDRTGTNTYEWVEPMKEVPGEGALVPIVHGDNLDNFKTPGIYFREVAGSDANIVANVPDAVHNSTFVLEVLKAGKDGQIVQRITRCNKVSQIVCQRCFYVDTWGSWYTTQMNNQRVLWEGSYYMTAGHDIKLTDKISNMEKGITLVFSSYDAANKKPVDANFHFFDIPKRFVQDHAGRGVDIFLTNPGFTAIGHKYLYIHDDHITGHANNGETGSGSGVTYNNKYYVLRYVLGH